MFQKRGDKKVLEVSKVLIETLVEFIDNPVEYVEVCELSNLKFGDVIVNCFRTFHTDNSVGYSFKDKFSKVTICGDLEFHNKEEKDRIIKSIEGSDKLIIDIVHLKERDSLELLKRFMHVDKILLPVPIGRDVLINESLKISSTRVPNDFDYVITKEIL